MTMLVTFIIVVSWPVSVMFCHKVNESKRDDPQTIAAIQARYESENYLFMHGRGWR